MNMATFYYGVYCKRQAKVYIFKTLNAKIKIDHTCNTASQSFKT